MFICANYSDGIPPRLYRSLSEIAEDISIIKAKIAKADEQLTVRSVLMDMISIWAEQSPEKWLPELEETVAEAREALDGLISLNETLDMLIDEFEEAKQICGG